MPLTAAPAPTQESTPLVSARSFLTCGDVFASLVAIAAVPTKTPSTGIFGRS